jgi:hypothetical protein
MGDKDDNKEYNFAIGDIVRESELIIPPDREPWTGIVVYVNKEFYELHSFLGPLEDLIAIHWLQAGYVESLPASVIIMVQKAKRKTEQNP